MLTGLLGGIILVAILLFLPKRDPKPGDGTNWPRLAAIAVAMLVGGGFLIALLAGRT